VVLCGQVWIIVVNNSFQWPNINSHFGIMDMCGFPKNIITTIKSWWTDKDVLHISTTLELPTGQAGWRDNGGRPLMFG